VYVYAGKLRLLVAGLWLYDGCHQNQEERKKEEKRRVVGGGHMRGGWIPGGMSTHPVRSVAHYGALQSKLLTTDADLSAYWLISHHMHAPNVTHTNEQTCKYVCVLRNAIICKDETLFFSSKIDQPGDMARAIGWPLSLSNSSQPREGVFEPGMHAMRAGPLVRTYYPLLTCVSVWLMEFVRFVLMTSRMMISIIYIAAYGFCPV
jgi:hypothetical protein